MVSVCWLQGMGKYCISAQAKNARTQILQETCFKTSAVRTWGHEFCLRCVAMMAVMIMRPQKIYGSESLREKNSHKEMGEIRLIGCSQMLPSKESTGWWFLSISSTPPCSFDLVSLINLHLCGEASKTKNTIFKTMPGLARVPFPHVKKRIISVLEIISFSCSYMYSTPLWGVQQSQANLVKFRWLTDT